VKPYSASITSNSEFIVCWRPVCIKHFIIHNSFLPRSSLNATYQRHHGVIKNPTAPKICSYAPCNLSLRACFAGITVSLGSVATYARCGGIFNTGLTANLPRSLPAKNFFIRLRFDRIKLCGPAFLAHPVGYIEKVFNKRYIALKYMFVLE